MLSVEWEEEVTATVLHPQEVIIEGDAALAQEVVMEAGGGIFQQAFLFETFVMAASKFSLFSEKSW